MILKSLKLHNFRNFSNFQAEFDNNITFIIGQNAKGKTTILEAVYVALTGTGFREHKENELIKFENTECLITVEFQEDKGPTLIQSQISKSGDSRVSKKFFINKTQKSFGAVTGKLPHGVLFAPEHIQIITGSPSRRREYVNSVLSRQDKLYKTKLRQYEEALRKRNKILEDYANLNSLHQEIEFWENYLVEQAEYITKKREDYALYLNTNYALSSKKFLVEYKMNPFSKDALQKNKDLEYRLRRTLIGPQKDDFIITIQKEIPEIVGAFGSRSEQRIALFWLKQNELLFLQQSSDYKPILLLDDIFSELDDHNRALVMELIVNYQTIATTTEVELKDLARSTGVTIML